MPAHTPYDGSSKPFAIGLKPLDLNEWIEVDAHLLDQLAEKARLNADIPGLVFLEEQGTRAAQQEILDLLALHLPARFPEVYRRDGDFMRVLEGLRISLTSDHDTPLRVASSLVQEDLILMRRSETGWRLAAGSLCFPSSWVLTEKFGRPLQEIHAPVPGFGPNTRNAELIARMFDRLHQPVERFNWSIQAGDALYHPLSDQQRIDHAARRLARFPDDAALAAAFIRVERQTLRKLPVSGDILFTIRIHLDPLSVLARHSDRASLAGSLASELSQLDAGQLDYKGLGGDRERLLGLLSEFTQQ